MLEFVDSGLYFEDKNNFINPLLQVESGSGSIEKSTGSGGPKINGSDRIRIIIPVKSLSNLYYYRIRLFQNINGRFCVSKRKLKFYIAHFPTVIIDLCAKQRIKEKRLLKGQCHKNKHLTRNSTLLNLSLDIKKMESDIIPIDD